MCINHGILLVSIKTEFISLKAPRIYHMQLNTFKINCQISKLFTISLIAQRITRYDDGHSRSIGPCRKCDGSYAS